MYKDDFICFKDVVFFFFFIYLRYVFNKEINVLLWIEVLRYCGIEEKNFLWLISRVVVLDWVLGFCKFDNKFVVGKLMEEVLGVFVEYRFGGIGSFCD